MSLWNSSTKLDFLLDCVLYVDQSGFGDAWHDN